MQFNWNLSDTNTNLYNTNGIYTKQINYHTHCTIEMKGKKRTQTEIIEYKSIIKNIHENYRLQIKLYTIQMEQIENAMFDMPVFVTQKTCSVH